MTTDNPDTIVGTDPKRLRIAPRPTLKEALRIALELPPTEPEPAEEMTDLRTLLRVTEE
jgi:hypothetical protein